jgi:hypothetical protein
VTRRLLLVQDTRYRLTVLQELGDHLVCRCVCDNVVEILRTNFLSGRTKSCGCRRSEVSRENRLTHGMSKTSLYACWRSMKTRCYNRNHRAYPWYGAKGIQVCTEWLDDFSQFCRDMGPTYFPSATLDRLKNEEDYSANNCQWLTKSDNSKKLHGYAPF